MRFGRALAHVADVDQAAELMLKLNRASSTDDGTASGRDDLLSKIAVSSNEVLGILSQIAPLKGQARKSLGTALRAATIREELKDVSTVNGDSLLRELQYIASASDAARHLSQDSIFAAVDCLRLRCTHAGSRGEKEPEAEAATTVPRDSGGRIPKNVAQSSSQRAPTTFHECPRHCLRGCGSLCPTAVQDRGSCDVCDRDIRKHESIHRCGHCDFWLCDGCERRLFPKAKIDQSSSSSGSSGEDNVQESPRITNGKTGRSKQ